MNKASLSVIIVSFNTKKFLNNCLASLQRHPPAVSFEILVVDNNSIDGSPEMVMREYQEVQLIRNTENVGFAAANNIAIEKSCGEILFFLNPDTEILPGTFNPLLKRFEEKPQTGIVGPTEQFANGTCYPTICPFPNLWLLWLSKTRLRQKHYFNPWINPYRRKWDKAQRGLEPVEVDWMSGASLMVRREVIEQVGMFDERYFFYMEETDLCKRAHHNDWKVEFVPEARIVHHGGGSANKTKPGLLTLSSALGELRYFKKYRRPVEFLGLRALLFFEYLFKSILIKSGDPRQWAYRETIRSVLGFRSAEIERADRLPGYSRT